MQSGFEIEKPTDEHIDLSSNHDIRCIEPCTISGYGTHIEISGGESQVRLSNFKFTLSDSSAVRIRTSSSGGSTTTFCNSHFFQNTGTLGGAIRIARESGQVNVVGSSFTSNEAVKGGAIYGGAQILLILDSLFLNNVAVKAVSCALANDACLLVSQHPSHSPRAVGERRLHFFRICIGLSFFILRPK